MNAITATLKHKSRIAGIAVFVFITTSAGRVFAQVDDLRQGGRAATPPDFETDLASIVQNISRTLIVLIGLVSVVMLIIGGFRYAVSAGDAEAVKGAKNTILYAIVGLVVAFLSFAAIEFVIDQLGGVNGNGNGNGNGS